MIGEFKFDANGDTSQKIIIFYTFDPTRTEGDWVFKEQLDFAASRSARSERPGIARSPASRLRIPALDREDCIRDRRRVIASPGRQRGSRSACRLGLWRRRDPRLLRDPAVRPQSSNPQTRRTPRRLDRRAPSRSRNALSLGAIYALVALGYTMVYGIIELINFAHGDVFMVGAFVAVFF